MKKIFILLSFLTLDLIYAHKNVQLEFTRENVYLLTSTHDYNEEINKSLILVDYTNILIDSLKYDKKIKIFNFQSNDKKMFSYKDKKDGLICFYRADLNMLDIKSFLNFINYILLNEKKLNLEKPIIFSELKENYKLVDKVISNEIHRPKEVNQLDNLINYSYYYKNNNFHFYKLIGKELVYKTQNFSQVESVSSYNFIVFLNNKHFDLIKDINRIISFNLLKEKRSPLKFKIININQDYYFIQHSWEQELILVNLKTSQITENFYNRFE